MSKKTFKTLVKEYFRLFLGIKLLDEEYEKLRSNVLCPCNVDHLIQELRELKKEEGGD